VFDLSEKGPSVWKNIENYIRLKGIPQVGFRFLRVFSDGFVIGKPLFI